MSLYEILLTLHVLAAVIWLGAGLMLTILFVLARRAADSAREAVYLEDSDRLGDKLFAPASLVTLVFGLLLVVEGPWDFGVFGRLSGSLALVLSP